MGYAVGAIPVLVEQYDGTHVDDIIALIGIDNFELRSSTVIVANYFVQTTNWVVVLESNNELYAVMTDAEFQAQVVVTP